MTDSDIIDRNNKLNEELEQLEIIFSSYTRRKVVDSFLVMIIALLIGVITIMGFVNYNLDSDVQNSDINQTQLICEHIPNRMDYVVCVKVGLPLTVTTTTTRK